MTRTDAILDIATLGFTIAVANKALQGINKDPFQSKTKKSRSKEFKLF